MRGRSFLLALSMGLAWSLTDLRAAEVVIHIDNFTFNPAVLSAKVGTIVKFENGDDIPHSVVETTAAFRSKVLDTGEAFSMTLSKPGDLAYFCGLHPHMTGRIIVEP